MKTILYRAPVLAFTFLLSVISVKAQLNTGGPLFLTTTGAISQSYKSPYAVTKEVAKLEETFVIVEGKSYKIAVVEGYEFAVFTNKHGKYKAFQILISNKEFTLLCEHYVAVDCDCFEGLYIAGNQNTMPLRVRELFPFSLKANLVDKINMYTDNNLETYDFEDVCKIVEYLNTP
jgi:hypothetical protein